MNPFRGKNLDATHSPRESVFNGTLTFLDMSAENPARSAMSLARRLGNGISPQLKLIFVWSE